MFKLQIPGDHMLELNYLVLDYNGTIACDGRLIPGVKDRITELSYDLHVHVLTADTFGNAKRELADLPCHTALIQGEQQARAKAHYIGQLGAKNCVCVGNGRNDAQMLRDANLGIAVVETEGCAMDTLLAADIVTRSIQDALDLLRNPLRLAATLRL